MSAYLHLDPAFVGGVTVAGHAGWSKLRSFAFGQLPAAGVQGANEIVVTKSRDSASPVFFRSCLQGVHYGRGGIVAKVDFTRPDGRGGEKTELSITLHGVVMERDQRSAGTRATLERYRLRYRKMTYSNMPPSSADVSLAVEQQLMNVRVGLPQNV
jgi:type VI protein secretion system component Hcp